MIEEGVCSSHRWTLFGLLVLLCGVNLADTFGYKPVIIVHGLFDGPKQFLMMSRLIQEAHPGTNVSVQAFKKTLYPIMQEAENGVHLICFSQGGLICRGLLSTLPDHNVQSFISLSSPQAGQYGDTEILKLFFPHYYLKARVFHVCYSSVGQKWSICNFWNDPHQRERFLKSSNYLSLLNGERPHREMTEWRKNFLHINKLVLIGGPDDGVITPLESSHFGFYDFNETIVEMKNQEWYVSDSFGLKTLHARGDLAVYVLSGVKHSYWHSNETVFRSCIEEWLT
uniref:palmitoyl-CoA hydrolase n=1 Tax=Hucho hucho TaxID=62062 RepID=A0A4W5KLR1_9TELE